MNGVSRIVFILLVTLAFLRRRTLRLGWRRFPRRWPLTRRLYSLPWRRRSSLVTSFSASSRWRFFRRRHGSGRPLRLDLRWFFRRRWARLSFRVHPWLIPAGWLGDRPLRFGWARWLPWFRDAGPFRLGALDRGGHWCPLDHLANRHRFELRSGSLLHWIETRALVDHYCLARAIKGARLSFEAADDSGPVQNGRVIHNQ